MCQNSPYKEKESILTNYFNKNQYHLDSKIRRNSKNKFKNNGNPLNDQKFKKFSMKHLQVKFKNLPERSTTKFKSALLQRC